MSPAYPMFEVIDEQELMPEYLMMWFARKNLIEKQVSTQWAELEEV